MVSFNSCTPVLKKHNADFVATRYGDFNKLFNKSDGNYCSIACCDVLRVILCLRNIHYCRMQITHEHTSILTLCGMLPSFQRMQLTASLSSRFPRITAVCSFTYLSNASFQRNIRVRWPSFQCNHFTTVPLCSVSSVSSNILFLVIVPVIAIRWCPK